MKYLIFFFQIQTGVFSVKQMILPQD